MYVKGPNLIKKILGERGGGGGDETVNESELSNSRPDRCTCFGESPRYHLDITLGKFQSRFG